MMDKIELPAGTFVNTAIGTADLGGEVANVVMKSKLHIMATYHSYCFLLAADKSHKVLKAWRSV